MSDKSSTGVGPIFALPDHAVISLHGRDAIAFAQAQFMNDLTALADRHWQWSGWLTPKGRVIALFAVLRLDAETLWLVLPDGDAATPLVERLRGFLFRSKVTIGLRDELKVGGRFEAPHNAGTDMAGTGDDGRMELDLGDGDAPRSLLIGASLEPVSDDDAVARWRAADLEYGLPRLVAAQREQWTPQQLSLERLHAFSVKKGCYPGQEIVARTHFLGKAKRGLALLAAASPMAAGSDVSGGDTTLGRVVASADAGEHHLALAVLPMERAEAALTVEGAAVNETELRSGLAR